MTQQDKFQTYYGVKKNEPGIMAILNRYIFHWPLFLIFIAFALIAGVIITKLKKPSFEIKATIAIKDSNKAPDAKGEVFDAIGISNPSQIIENEIKILKSRELVSKVVQDLNLWISYQEKGDVVFKNDNLAINDLYNDGPIKLNISGPAKSEKLVVTVLDKDFFNLVTENGETKKLKFNTPYKTKLGSWEIQPTNNLKQYLGKSIIVNVADAESITLSYQKTISAILSDKLGTSIDLGIADNNAQRGKDILNSLIQNYYNSASLEKNKDLKNTLDFLDQRIASLTGALSTTEKGIEGFKSSKGLTDISSKSKMSLENLQSNDAKLNEVNIQLDVIEGFERYLNQRQVGGNVPSAIGINDAALNDAIAKLSSLQLQYDGMAATMPETNPEFEQINRQIKTTKTSIRESIRNIKSSLSGTKNKLQSYNSRFEASIKDIPGDERQLIKIQRQQLSKENTYNYLLQKREEVAIKYASNLTEDKVIDKAYAEQANNSKAITLIICLGLGLAVPFAIIFIRDLIGNKIYSSNDISDAIDVPIAGELPFETNKSPFVFSEDMASAVSEQLRALRIKLYYLHGKKESGRVTLITSSISKEGKSFVSLNLSAATSLAFKKTIVLELDLRRPELINSLGLPTGKGISDYLNDNSTIADIIQPSKLNPNLDVISSGTLVNNPSELLEKPRFAELINHLKKIYDDIIIDSPPVHLVPDASVISNYADVTLYVIRQGVTSKVELDFLEQLIAQEQLVNVSIVFNSVKRVKYGYGYKFDDKYYNNAKRGLLEPVFGDFGSRF